MGLLKTLSLLPFLIISEYGTCCWSMPVFDNETLSEFAKKDTLRIIPHQFLTRQHDTVELTHSEE